MPDRIVLANEQPFSIGAVEVRPPTRSLAVDGVETIVEPRVMQVLVALGRARGMVVSRDDLIDRCWDGRIVGDDAINRVLSRLRHLGQAVAGGAFRIETITRVGYRLVMDGNEIGATDAPSLSATLPSGATGGGGATIGRRGLIGGAAAATLAPPASAYGGGTGRPSDLLSAAARAAVARGDDALRDTLPDRAAEAVAAYRQANRLAPDDAEPWGRLALAYNQQVHFGGGGNQIAAQQLEAREREAIIHALAIEPGNADALTARVGLGNDDRLAQDLACRSLLTRFPDHVPLNRIYAALLVNVGRLREAIGRLRHAIAVDSDWPQSFSWLTLQLLAVGNLDEADAVIDKAIALWPRHYSVWFTRLRLLAYTGRGNAALAMLDDVPNRPIGIPDWNFETTAAETRALESRAAADIDAASRLMVDAAHRAAGLAENAIVFHAAVGRIEQAFTLIDAYFFDRGFTVGTSFFSRKQGQFVRHHDRQAWFLFGRDCAALRADHRFAALTGAIGLDDYWRRSGSRPDDVAASGPA